MEISVVIATRNRRARVVSLLENLSRSLHPIREIIIVDSSDEAMQASEYTYPGAPPVVYLRSEPSVCIQRNLGIRTATAEWIAICDDDIEVPEDYYQKLAAHIEGHPGTGAVSGLFLQREGAQWTGRYDIASLKELLLKFTFQLGIWGEITCSRQSALVRRIQAFYRRRGNHISRAGWPVITQFSGSFVTVPVYSLGASLVRRDWLLASPYDEVLDRHGIGDNYGVSIGFPAGIDIVTSAYVYHHQEPANRVLKPLQYYRRAMALDYFIRRRQHPYAVSRAWLAYSLLGNWIIYLASGDRLMAGPAWKTFRRVLRGNNPYLDAADKGQKVAEPLL